MPPTRHAHPSRDQLVAFGLGKLDPASQDEIERHVAKCDACCQALRTVPDDTLLNRIKGDETCAFSPGTIAGTHSARSEPDLPPELSEHPRYRIVKLLGSGGMGQVYQAEHRLMDRLVALKIISRNYTSNPTAVERFRQEVKAAARLSHTNIVAAFDAEQAGGYHFLVMEFVEGMSLAHWVQRRGPLSIEAAAHYAWQTARGLQHAHEQGMVHRDIKPQNLMRTPRGGIKILDFGLARLAREQGLAESAAAAESSSAGDITQAGTVLGTPDYIAPEQAYDSRQVDIRADIYSLGCTLYFLLAGHPPFPQGSTTQKLKAHLDRPVPSLAGLRHDLPTELLQVVERMMAKNPDQRYQTPAEVMQALEPFKPSAAGAAELQPASPPESAAAGFDVLENAVSVAARSAASGSGIRQNSDRTAVAASTTRPDPLFASALAPVAQLAPAWRTASRSGTSWQLLARRHRTPLIAAGAIVGVLLLSFMVVPPVWRAIASAAGSRSASDSRLPDPTQQSGPIQKPGPAVQSLPAGKKASVVIVVPPHYWSPDYQPVRDVLESQGIEVQVASLTLAPATDASERRQPDVHPDLTIERVDPSTFDAVVFIGGQVWELQSNQADTAMMRRLLAEIQRSETYLAALCKGIAIPANGGFFDGKRVACGQYIEDLAGKCHAVVWDREQPVVVDGRVITGRDDTVAESFARNLAELLRSGDSR